MAEGDRPVEGEIDDRRDDESRRPGELRRQADVSGADKGDRGVDEIADEADRREGRDLLRDAPMRGDGRLAGVHGRTPANWVSARQLWPKTVPLSERLNSVIGQFHSDEEGEREDHGVEDIGRYAPRLPVAGGG